MAPASKQADRKAAKKAAKQDDAADAAAPVQAGSFSDLGKVLLLGSCLAQVAPKLPDIVKDAKAELEGKGKKAEETSAPPKVDETDALLPKEEESAKPPAAGGPVEIFASLQARLVWFNFLGLGMPETAEDAMSAWLALKELEIDYGPRKKRNASPGVERITANVYKNLPQYLHVLLALMMVRAFLFRSFFACLPWLAGYQFLSLFVPLEGLPQLPQVPWEKIPVGCRVALTMGIHALVWFFFAFEVLWKTYWFELFLLIGLFTYHAYAVRPAQ